MKYRVSCFSSQDELEYNNPKRAYKFYLINCNFNYKLMIQWKCKAV